ncbi:hypothetical protein ACFFHT_07225 [Gallibacterium melopsittaci]|uniref:Uncharacterized protein n=1 Tax=Gallibacterium melopsittaci TaxID=516063 RepID=A0ABV6HXH5_9PAST
MNYKIYNSIILCIFGLSLPLLVNADFYKIEIRREQSNLYKTREGFYIKTKYCYEYAYGEEAILSYDRYSYDNKLIFQNGNSCEIERLLN